MEFKKERKRKKISTKGINNAMEKK